MEESEATMKIVRNRMDAAADFSAMRHGIKWCATILVELRDNYAKRLGVKQEERLAQAIKLLNEEHKWLYPFTSFYVMETSKKVA